MCYVSAGRLRPRLGSLRPAGADASARRARQDEAPTLSVSRPQTGLSFLCPEPEDLEDLYSRFKVSGGSCGARLWLGSPGGKGKGSLCPCVRPWTLLPHTGGEGAQGPRAHVCDCAPRPPLQKLQQELEFLEVQEEYIKDEQKNLKKEFLHAQEEVKRIQSIPLVIGQFLEAVDQNTAIVGSTTGSTTRGGAGTGHRSWSGGTAGAGSVPLLLYPGPWHMMRIGIRAPEHDGNWSPHGLARSGPGC